MLLIRTMISKSKIHGFGLFSGEFIHENQIIAEYCPEIDKVFDQMDIDLLPEKFQNWMRTYLFVNHDRKLVFCGDNAKYMNHSYEPNCSETRTGVIARRDIMSGEELTCDYRQMGLEGLYFDFSQIT